MAPLLTRFDCSDIGANFGLTINFLCPHWLQSTLTFSCCTITLNVISQTLRHGTKLTRVQYWNNIKLDAFYPYRILVEEKKSRSCLEILNKFKK